MSIVALIVKDTAITRRQNRGTTCVASSVAELFIISKSVCADQLTL